MADMTADPFANMTSEDEEAKLDAVFGPLPMTRAEAYEIRISHDRDAKTISRLSKRALDSLAASERPGIRIYGQSSKDELIREILDNRYPIARMNESIHVLYHVDGLTNSICEWCVPEVPGLAEHTEAAACQHAEIDQIGDCAGCGLSIAPELAVVQADADTDFPSVPGLAEHTEAACDTITRAAE